MPIRKIPKSFRAVTGRFPSVLNNGRCVGYESKLEHDYYLTLEFDRSVQSYEEQPFEVPGVVNGINVNYIPDCLVTYKDNRKKLLVECKYSTDLTEENHKLQRKIARLTEYALEHDLDFKVITEKDIAALPIQNYLRIYRKAKLPVNFGSKRVSIDNAFKRNKVLTFRELLQATSTNPTEQANFTPIIWHMLFTGELITDMDKPITFNSLLKKSNG